VRRLAAILAADVVGYSRLMEANEEGTMVALRQHRREFFEPTVTKHSGRIFKVMGDGFLVEFGSVLNAARCAVDIQRGMLERNAGAPEDRHIKFRIGIHLGDIIVEGDDFYGDGVNMAARLEGLAGPGGIACSAVVRTQIGNKLGMEFLDQGEKTVKNIAQPVHVYFINLAAVAPTLASQAAAGQAPVKADKPSVAILPFANMSNDPEQEFFSDGITEDIITDLSKVSGLFVLGRNTVFTYKGKAVNLEKAAKELGVAYLLEGSVRKAGQKVRINAQLIDGTSGGHVWADRYDRDLTDIFAIQDEITEAIVGQLKVKLLPQEKKAIEQAPTQNLEAYAYFLKGREFLHLRNKSGFLLAKTMFAKAIELDPLYARAYAGMADCDSFLSSRYGVVTSIDDIMANASKALAIDPHLAEAHAARGHALTTVDRRPEAEAAFERAVALDPNSYEVNFLYGEFRTKLGHFEQAAKLYLRASEIMPADYRSPQRVQMTYCSLGRQQEAEEYARIAWKRVAEVLKLHPDDSKALQLGAGILAFLGERDRARELILRALAIDPDDIHTRYNAACIYSLLGESDRAIKLLEIWVGHVGSDVKSYMLHDSDLDPIRSHPYYQNLLLLAGLQPASDTGRDGS
jgi:adenylate cyclase